MDYVEVIKVFGLPTLFALLLWKRLNKVEDRYVSLLDRYHLQLGELTKSLLEMGHTLKDIEDDREDTRGTCPSGSRATEASAEEHKEE